MRPRGGYGTGMRTINVGLVADPAFPTQVARRLGDLGLPRDSDRDAWDVEMVSEPFTTGSEDAGTALDRLQEQAHEHGWDLVVGLTELPLRDGDGRYLLAKNHPHRRAAVVSLPALGGLRVHARSRRAVRSLVEGMADSTLKGPITASPCPASLAGGGSCSAWCSPTGRGSSCPGSSPHSSRRWRPGRSPRSTRPCGSWPGRSPRGAWSWRRWSRWPSSWAGSSSTASCGTAPTTTPPRRGRGRASTTPRRW